MSRPAPPSVSAAARSASGVSSLPPEFYDQDDADNACYVCENPRFEPLLVADRFGFPVTYQQCACGLIKQTPMPNERFFEWFFNSDEFFSASEDKTQGEIWGYHDFFADESCRMATSRRRYRRLEDLLDAGGKKRIMKIGPSTGTFLHVAKENGHTVRGCDVSERFREYAQTNYGVTIDHGRFERQGYPDDSFDALFLLNVIENVPNQVEFLSAISRTIAPGGLFVLNYVDMRRNVMAALQGANYFLYRPPVTYAFPREVLNRLLDRFGFTVERTLRDVRTLHLEKITTLLGWRWAWKLSRALRVHRIEFPVYAYPSRIVVARKR